MRIGWGLDKWSSLDSVQQMVFAFILTGKTPVVVIYDTDNDEGAVEYRIRTVCEEVGIEYISKPTSSLEIETK